MSLRDYQLRALADCRAHLAAGKRAPLIVSPCGTGKTRTCAEAYYLHAELGGIPLWVAPRRELIDQATATLSARGVERPLVRSNQELALPGANLPPATLVVWDEAHHAVAGSWSRLRAALPGAIFLGASATPERGDGVGLGAIFDCLVEAITVPDAVAAGYLVPFETLRPDRALGPNELAQDPIDATLQHGRGSTIVFARNVETAREYAAAFQARGVTAAALWGDMPARERDRVLASYAAGETRILCNSQLLTEGVDVPRTETITLARGFGTAGAYLQAVGRGSRPSPGKRSSLVLDLRGVSHVHGEPDEPRTWHLEGRACRRASDDPNIRFCAVCGSVLSVADLQCPECGREGTHRLRPPRILGLPIDRFAVLRRADDGERAARLKRWFSEARSKGWREGQAMHRYKGAFGEFPPRHIIQAARR